MPGKPTQPAWWNLFPNAYLFDYLPEEADSLMSNFVDDFPDYRPVDADPAEFALLLKTHLRARGIDPDAPLVTADDIVDTVDQGIRPVERPIVYKPPFVYSNSMGFQVGINATFPQIIERYSIGDPAEDGGSFEVLAGFQLGATVNLMLSKSIETSFGLSYNRTNYSFTASPLTFSTYTYEENQNHLQLPASVMFRLNPQGERTSVYLRLGIMADFIMGALGSGTLSYTESLRDVVLEKTNITESRARLNLHGLAGVGIRFPLENAFIFLETRFTTGLFLVNREENRYDNDDVTWLIYHVDSDFKIHQLSFTVGMAWNL